MFWLWKKFYMDEWVAEDMDDTVIARWGKAYTATTGSAAVCRREAGEIGEDLKRGAVCV